MYDYIYGFLSQGFTDRREIVHGDSAWSRTGLLPFWGDSPRDGRVLGVNRGHMTGYASCWSTCFVIFPLAGTITACLVENNDSLPSGLMTNGLYSHCAPTQRSQSSMGLLYFPVLFRMAPLQPI